MREFRSDPEPPGMKKNKEGGDVCLGAGFPTENIYPIGLPQGLAVKEATSASVNSVRVSVKSFNLDWWSEIKDVQTTPLVCPVIGVPSDCLK